MPRTARFALAALAVPAGLAGMLALALGMVEHGGILVVGTLMVLWPATFPTWWVGSEHGLALGPGWAVAAWAVPGSVLWAGAGVWAARQAERYRGVLSWGTWAREFFWVALLLVIAQWLGSFLLGLLVMGLL